MRTNLLSKPISTELTSNKSSGGSDGPWVGGMCRVGSEIQLLRSNLGSVSVESPMTFKDLKPVPEEDVADHTVCK